MGSNRIVCVDDFEKFALETLPTNVLDYYRSGANDETTLSDNVAAFKRWKIFPRMLRDVAERDVTTTILGHSISFPVCIAPSAFHKMAHPLGEVATAQGAYKAGTAYTLSSISSCNIEEVAAAAPDALRFFQIYVLRNRNLMRQLVERAETHGYKAIIVTVDSPILGKRLADERNQFKLPPHVKMANFESMEFEESGKDSEESWMQKSSKSLVDPSLTWADVTWLKSFTHLPIVVKGVLTEEDALEAVRVGVDGIVVSNHGARQLDTVPATIDVLCSIVRAVSGRCEVYLDGGVRLGTDVFKALALGAQAVFVGRPAIYSLAYNGADGVSQMLDILKEEFSSAMALAGCRNVSDIKRDLVKHESVYLARL